MRLKSFSDIRKKTSDYKRIKIYFMADYVILKKEVVWFYIIKEKKMGNREKLEIPTIEFTAVTLLDTGASSTCSSPCDGYVVGEDKMYVDFNGSDDIP